MFNETTLAQFNEIMAVERLVIFMAGYLFGKLGIELNKNLHFQFGFKFLI